MCLLSEFLIRIYLDLAAAVTPALFPTEDEKVADSVFSFLKCWTYYCNWQALVASHPANQTVAVAPISAASHLLAPTAASIAKGISVFSKYDMWYIDHASFSQHCPRTRSSLLLRRRHGSPSAPLSRARWFRCTTSALMATQDILRALVWRRSLCWCQAPLPRPKYFVPFRWGLIACSLKLVRSHIYITYTCFKIIGLFSNSNALKFAW